MGIFTFLLVINVTFNPCEVLEEIKVQEIYDEMFSHYASEAQGKPEHERVEIMNKASHHASLYISTLYLECKNYRSLMELEEKKWF